ncbi:Peroxiredoxin-2C [Dichanthelium oligosanthes]|uniref:glutaredoxin-dependent peroxiredoxin n=1 Tax=Dichanthelium oligosanthes TaxID=888268 RepID=A0A1E5UWH1_9POAL|nr:Peroxiredoxin-2C [Dichanthelium oligosanthes]
MAVYDPAADAAVAQQRADKRAPQEEATTSSSSADAAMVVPHAAAEPLTVLDVEPINAVQPRLPPAPPPLPPDGREEPPCLRKHFLRALGLRADLPVHFIDDKYVTPTDVDPRQTRFRIPCDGVRCRLRAILTPRELYDANLLHDPLPMARKRPRQEQQPEPQNGSADAEGEQPPGKKIKKQGKVHGGLRVKLVDLAAGAKELLMSRWDSNLCTIVKGGGFTDFIRRCSFGEGDAVEIWAFGQRRFQLFGSVVCDDSLLHLLVVERDRQQPPWCRSCTHDLPLAAAVNPSTELVMARLPSPHSMTIDSVAMTANSPERSAEIKMTLCSSSGSSKRKRPVAAAKPRAGERRRRQEDPTMASSADQAGAMVPYVLDVEPINAIPLQLPPPPAAREEPPCLRKHFLRALGLRIDLPVHFVDEKRVTSTDLQANENRSRTKKKSPKRQQPEEPQWEPQNDDAEGEQPPGKKVKQPRKKGKVHGGLSVKLVDLAAGAKELLMSTWTSSRCTIVKGSGYQDFIKQCSLNVNDVVEVWAFVERRFRLFGVDVGDDGPLHVLIVKKHQQQPWCRYCPHPVVSTNSPCFAGSKCPLEMVVYDPAAAAKPAREAAETSTASPSSSSTNAAALALHAASASPPFGDYEPINAIPISAAPPRLPPLPRMKPSPLVADREEPPCLRKHFLKALGLRDDLIVHFIDEKYVTETDMDPHQNRFRIPSDGIQRRLRAVLTQRELDDANLLHDPPPNTRKRPRHEPITGLSSEPQNVAAEGEQPPGKKMKIPKKKGKVHGGLRMKLVDLNAGAKELLMSRWESSRGTIVKGEGYLDFIRRCSFGEGDAVEIWAFVQRRFQLFGSVAVLFCVFLLCSMQHVPGFITQAEQLKAKGVDEILLISGRLLGYLCFYLVYPKAVIFHKRKSIVNDPFVMKAWAKTYPENKHVKFLADGSGSYTKALGLELDLTEKGLGIRSRRFALLADNLKVTVANIEEGGQFTISGAEEILKAL